MGEGALDFKFLPAGGQFHLCGSDQALTPHGGLVAWDHFLQHCGEDAFHRLCADLDATQVDVWFAPAEQIRHHSIPPNAAVPWGDWQGKSHEGLVQLYRQRADA